MGRAKSHQYKAMLANWMRGVATAGAGLVAMLWCPTSLSAANDDRRPNVVIVLADDLGFGDVHCSDPDLENDPGEKQNALADHPDPVRELTALMQSWS